MYSLQEFLKGAMIAMSIGSGTPVTFYSFGENMSTA